MVKIQFKNLPDTTTPVNAENLNAIQTNTENAINEVDGNIDLATKTLLSTTSGKNQEITGCAGASGKLNIESGETYQTITTGKNLLPINIASETTQSGVTITKLKNGKYSLNGTSTSNITWELYSGTNITIPAGTYTGSIGDRTNIVDGYIRLNNGDYQTIFDNTHDTNTFTISQSFTFNRFYIYIANGKTFNNQIIEPMLENGSSETSYEPYTEGIASPSPDFPQEIVNVGSNINLLGLPDKTTTTSYGITYSISNNELTLNGTATSNGTINISNLVSNIELTNGYNYTFISEESGKSSRTYNVQFRDSNDTAITSMYNNDFPITKNTLSGTISKLYLYVYNGMTFNNVKLKLKIQEGSQATGYSKYGCGSVDYKVHNRNLLVLKDGTYTSGNLTAVVKNGKVTLNGTNGSSTTFIEIPLEFDAELELGKQYAISINNPTTAGDTTNYGSFRIDSAGIVDLKFSTINNKRKITINDDIFSHLYTKTLIRIRTAANLSYNNFVIYPQIEEGDTYSDYQKGRKEIVTIPLPQGMELCKIGNYQDCLYKASGKWYKHKEIGKVVLDGTETISVTNTGTSYWYYNIIKATGIITNSDPNRNNAVCDNYLIVSINSSSDYQGIFILKSGSIRIRYGTEDTAENFKTWLGTHNVTIYYVLETPVEEEITDKDTIYYLEHFPIYKEYTNIECINDVKPDMHIDYLYDNEVNNYWGAELDSLAAKLHNLEVGE